MAADADRHLLFGLLALQNGLIQQAQLVAAFHAWTLDKSRHLADHLEALGHLNAAQRSAIEALAALHVEKHDGDPEQSLEALRVGSSTLDPLREMDDGEITASLASVGRRSTDPGGDSTATFNVGTTSADGQRFRVLRSHARGGLGAVFVALDSELNREVALKQILDKHADDPASRQRFVLEAEITGGLEHPGIVPVYGLGTYAGGRPFYAMRFIRGDSLKDAINRFHRDPALKSDPGRRSLELRKLLRRFLDVCNAIEYAHSRGVVHRDIKPGNVIVGKHGETLVVDWGVAKAVGRPGDGSTSDERTLVPTSAGGGAETLPGSVLGTPGYMSPEQARGDLDALGPRSDVYSLGATLYALLAGKQPFQRGEGDVLRRVQAGVFPPPRALDPSIDRALEAVCLKAMALRPEDRYDSPRALTEDIERWTADESVSAWREPVSRRARRWARRNRTVVTGAAVAVLAALLGLGAVAVVQARANTDLKSANAATTREKNKAEAALTNSEEARRRAEAVLGFLKDDVLAATRPEGQEGGLGKDVSVRKAVDAAEPRIAGAFKDQPAVEADVRDTLGTTYYHLGEIPLAIRQYERAWELRRIKLGPDHPDTLNSRTNLADAYRSAGRLDEAIKLHEATLKRYETKLGPAHPATLVSRSNLAEGYNAVGRRAEAIRLQEEIPRLLESRLGPDHPDTLTSRNNLAGAYWSAGRLDEAIMLFETTLKLRESRLGPDHPATLTSRNNLATAYESLGRIDEAIQVHEATVKLRESKLGPAHPDTLISRNNLAGAYWSAGRLDEAIQTHEATLKLRESKLGPDDLNTLLSRNNLATAYESLGRWAEGETLRRGSVGRRRKTNKPDSPLLAGDLDGLGVNLMNQAKWTEAEPVLRECLMIREKALPDDWKRFSAMSLLGGVLIGQGSYAEAEPLVVRGHDGLKHRAARVPARYRPRLAEAAVRVVQLYEAWGQPAKAAEWKKKLGLEDLPADVFARP